MALSVAFFIVIIAVIAIWFILEFKRMRHKILAIFLIGLVLFGYFTINAVVLSNPNVNLGTVDGVITAGKIYFSWLVSVFSNVKTVTSNAIKMNWSYGHVSG